MQAKSQILDAWQDAVVLNVHATFYLVYGASVGQERYDETVDAFGREDCVRIVKSCDHLVRDMPTNVYAAPWHGKMAIGDLIRHVADDDYPPDTRVSTSPRDPNINMYSEQVTEANALQDLEPCEDAYNYAQLKDTLDDPHSVTDTPTGSVD